jgi:hypothetical protein
MKRFLSYVTCVLLLSGSNAPGAVFERDWKTAGDGLLTYDDVNQREWLDVPLTLLSQYSGTTEDRFQAVIAQTAPGGLYEGFASATTVDVIAFAESAGVNSTTLDFASNCGPTSSVLKLLGITFVSRDREYSMGLLDELPANPDYPGDRGVAIFMNDPEAELAGLRVAPASADDLIRSARVGVTLFRSVPEPLTLAKSACLISVVLLITTRSMRLL